MLAWMVSIKMCDDDDDDDDGNGFWRMRIVAMNNILTVC